MKSLVMPELSQLLPELFPKARNAPETGVMCDPVKGCGPAAQRPPTDIISLLTPTAKPTDEEKTSHRRQDPATKPSATNMKRR